MTSEDHAAYHEERALSAIGRREAFGLNFDPSRLYWQFGDPVKFINCSADRIHHVHTKDAQRILDGEFGSPSSRLSFGDDHRRG